MRLFIIIIIIYFHLIFLHWILISITMQRCFVLGILIYFMLPARLTFEYLYKLDAT